MHDKVLQSDMLMINKVQADIVEKNFTCNIIH